MHLGILPFYDSIYYHNCLLFCFVSVKLMDYNNYFAYCISHLVLRSRKVFGPVFLQVNHSRGMPFLFRDTQVNLYYQHLLLATLKRKINSQENFSGHFHIS